MNPYMGKKKPTREELEIENERLRRMASYVLFLLIALERKRWSKKRIRRAIMDLRMNSNTPLINSYHAVGDPLCPLCDQPSIPTGYHDIVSDTDTTVNFLCWLGHSFFVLDPLAKETQSGWLDKETKHGIRYVKTTWKPERRKPAAEATGGPG